MAMIQSVLTSVDTTQQHELGARHQDESGNEYIYLEGVASTVVGSWVTFTSTYATALLTADDIGIVAVALAATVASRYGWYQIYGSAEASLAANCAAGVVLRRETSNGVAGDGAAAGDNIRGALSVDSTTTAAVATVQLSYPFVDDDSN